MCVCVRVCVCVCVCLCVCVCVTFVTVTACSLRHQDSSQPVPVRVCGARRRRRSELAPSVVFNVHAFTVSTGRSTPPFPTLDPTTQGQDGSLRVSVRMASQFWKRLTRSSPAAAVACVVVFAIAVVGYSKWEPSPRKPLFAELDFTASSLHASQAYEGPIYATAGRQADRMGPSSPFAPLWCDPTPTPSAPGAVQRLLSEESRPTVRVHQPGVTWYLHNPLDISCRCNVRCIWTWDPSVASVETADVILNVNNANPASEFHPNRTNVLKALLCIEPYPASRLLALDYNLTVTYLMNSTVPLTYAGTDMYCGMHHHPRVNCPPSTHYKPFLEGGFVDYPKSDELVAVYLNSGCYGRRQAYMTELMKHMKVHSFGKCLNNAEVNVTLPQCTQMPGTSWAANKRCILGHFKFAMAFENTQLPDYVTEKLFMTLDVNTIPVYFGAPNVQEFVPGRKSFINADDFASPAELARFLTNLASDPKEYASYFEWRQRPLNPSYVEKWHNRLETVFCRTCEAAYKLMQARDRGAQ